MKEESGKIIYDLIGIGLGPFNLGLAALLEKVPEIDALFFEQKEQFSWHPGMLIEGATLQVPFLADLVSMADVTSPYSLLNYLQSHQRLYKFYFLERFHIPRTEYNAYCQWVAEQLDSCLFGAKVLDVEKHDGYYEVKVFNQKSRQLERFYAEHLVLGVGTQPAVPASLEGKLGDSMFHSSEYLNRKDRCLEAESIAIIGSGQSAAEVFYDLLEQQTDYRYSLDWFTRSKGFFPMEYSKLGLEHFSPDYIHYFYQLPQYKKDETLQSQDLLYKGISAETISDIYDLLYERTIGDQNPPVHLQAMTEIQEADRCRNTYHLKCWQWHSEQSFSRQAEVVILGTGYKPVIPSFMSGVYPFIDWDEQGRYQVERNYQLKLKPPYKNDIFIQNGELHTHGIGAPDLGLGAYRNAVIINTITGKGIYKIDSRNVFQTFSTKASAERVTV
ncbi:lysine N6-hydroxylase [Scopulibacillus daqui]|uniref:L-lysine N6-monooxygenase MbtG n=1 Tax=Scopulibacillus daqui TaxID=1469162 RepID=A0ABS2PWV6_9BACL|nr:lysine N(6)-hydroxylase/L-ornithine N(5)-oxygenase family protein [Scopulibacillus daqui]MBM7644523.1 lysine N6-hydroxylase [Scopulibacillus daqui]